MVIHACVFSQALFSTELHWRTKLYASAITSEHLSCSLLTSAELSLSHTWLYSALTRYDSSALFDATPACPHTLSGPVLHTYVSDSSTQSPDALFSIVLKPPAGVFSTTDRRFFDHRPANTGYRPATAGYRPATAGYRPATAGYRPATAGYRTATERLPPATDRLPPAADRLPPATDRLPPATDRLPPTTDRLSSATAGYRPATAGYRPATDRLPPTTDRLPPATSDYRPATAGYRRLPPTTAGYRPATAGRRLPPVADYRRSPTTAGRRLPPVAGYRRLYKKKKKNIFSFCRLRNATRALYKQSSRFGDWEMPIVPKNFRDTCYKMRTVCVSLYI